MCESPPPRYAHGKLVEINSHSIMSKWFAESGKLVQRLFTRVLEMVEDSSCFVVVLIDEVESLTSARAGAMNGREPTDAIRVRPVPCAPCASSLLECAADCAGCGTNRSSMRS